MPDTAAPVLPPGRLASGLNGALPPVEFTAFSASTVVLREADLNAWGSDDMVKLDQLIMNVRAHHARVLVRQVGSRENAIRLLRLGVDLIALSGDSGPRV